MDINCKKFKWGHPTRGYDLYDSTPGLNNIVKIIEACNIGEQLESREFNAEGFFHLEDEIIAVKYDLAGEYLRRQFIIIKKDEFNDKLQGKFWLLFEASWGEASSMTITVVTKAKEESENSEARFLQEFAHKHRPFLKNALKSIFYGKKISLLNIERDDFKELLRAVVLCLPRKYRLSISFCTRVVEPSKCNADIVSVKDKMACRNNDIVMDFALEYTESQEEDQTSKQEPGFSDQIMNILCDKEEIFTKLHLSICDEANNNYYFYKDFGSWVKDYNIKYCQLIVEEFLKEPSSFPFNRFKSEILDDKNIRKLPDDYKLKILEKSSVLIGEGRIPTPADMGSPEFLNYVAECLGIK